jgi:hypothetical protein
MTAADDEANRRHLAALIGSRDTRWQEHIEQGLKVLDTQWDKLPRSFIRRWWKATDYGQRPPSLGSAAQLPELLTAAQAKLEHTKREIAADTAHARGFLSKAAIALRRVPTTSVALPSALLALDAA